MSNVAAVTDIAGRTLDKPEVVATMSDAMSEAARYRARQTAGESESSDADVEPPMVLNAQNKSEFVETAIQIAIRQGAFDNLPGAGKPIEGLGTHHDPDWWIRRKIESENLTGLGPPAIMLRTEDQELDDSLDDLGREEDVRAVLEDFNKRVIEARRQLMGGPPVVTKTRDVDAEVAAWRRRRHTEAEADATAAPSVPQRHRPRWGRRRSDR